MNKYGFAALAVLSLTLMGAGCNKTQETTPEPTPEPAPQEQMQDKAFTPTHEVISEESVVNWAAEKVVGSGHEGTLTISSGTLALDEEGSLMAGEFVLDMTSINSTDLEGKGKENLDNHLKNSDFFDVENHPEGMFKIVSVLETDEGITITGDLTLKGITNSVSFPATITNTDEAMISTASVTIDRTLWDIRYGSGKFFDDLGDNVIKDEIEISLKIEAKKI